MKLLMIAGMGESVALAQALGDVPGVSVTCVSEGRAVARARPPVRIYDGFFKEDADFERFLNAEGFDFIVDAAHPFRLGLGAVAQKMGLRYLRVTRPIWTQQREWICVPTIPDAIAVLPKAARVFVVTGRGSLHCFKTRPDLCVLCRQLEVHDFVFPLSKGNFVFGEGPFSVAQEIETFQRLDVGYLVLRNTGSKPGASKLQAAARAGVQVIMLDPPVLDLPAEQIARVDVVVDRIRDALD